MTRDVQRFMIDSGAFSVWTKGEEVNLDNYIEFCKEYDDVIDYVVSLDVIPPKNATRKEIDKACSKGWDNYLKMLDGGLSKEKLIPVFHYMDNFKWLEKFMEEEIPYFGLGGIAKASSMERQMWLDTCMKYICDKDGMPMAKLHGFGVTSVPVMVRYPWYSCDSTSWLKFAIYGSVLIPHKKQDGTWDFNRSPLIIPFSTKAKREGHFNFQPPIVQKILLKYLEDAGVKLGKSKFRKEPLDYKHDAENENIFAKEEDHMVVEEIIESGVSNEAKVRCEANVYFYRQVEDSLTWPRPFKPKRTKSIL